MPVVSLKSIGIVIAGGTADAIAAEIIDKKDFNLSSGGWRNLLEITLTGVLIAFSAILFSKARKP
jgi:hypothetical protein